MHTQQQGLMLKSRPRAPIATARLQPQKVALAGGCLVEHLGALEVQKQSTLAHLRGSLMPSPIGPLFR